MGEPVIALVDGEHYPPVIARALRALRDRGEDPVLALFVGGGEKLGQVSDELSGLGVDAERAEDPEADLAAAIDRTGAGRVIDLSDEPVLGYVARCRLASVALWKGAAYQGADFTFTPPDRRLRPPVPSVGVIGTGKRTGKTAIGGAIARNYRDAGRRPVVVAMGRGGPPEPEVIDGKDALEPEVLMQWVSEGRHAASDYIEDALMARVPTVGAWRAGGGLAGATSFSNYDLALERASELAPGMLVLEGSGAAIPPAHFDAGILVVNAGIDPGHLRGYFGLYRLLLADLVVLTMCEDSIPPDHLAAVEDCLRSRPLTQVRVARTVFRPHPLDDITGKRIWLATTAPKAAGDVLARHLETEHGAEVVGISHALANRERLRRDLDRAAGADVILVELKAAAVDVVTRFGLDRGISVAYVDNRPWVVGDDEPLEARFEAVADLANERFDAGRDARDSR